jgi:hypothetical protein
VTTRGAEALWDADEIAVVCTREIAEAVWPDRCGDPHFVGALGLSVSDNTRALLATFAGTLDIGEANPEGAFAFAELTAELAIPVSELESAYWVGARALWREWFIRARAAGDQDGDDLLDRVDHVTTLIFDYVIQIMSAVVARYDVTRAEILRNREDRRRAVLGQILDGSVRHVTTETENALGYRLRGTHIAVALKVDERAQAERAAAELAQAASADASMMQLQAPGSWMLWLGFLGGVGPERIAALTQAAGAAGVEMGIGDPAPGVEGLRRTSEQALQIVHLRRRVPAGLPPVVRYSEVRIELLMLHDEDAARVFVQDELGELARYDERSDRTCETVLAWLATGSQMDAAAQLGVHKNTMRLRIAYAEDVLGHRLSQRRSEIAVAMRMRELLRPV